ncbi:MAG: hypothetical protein XD81_1245 [Bacteroidetes bacterium 38_7]|nr:MAG: hypothetical protein XD81_1245 [Bacteroidetes bacterium 38_7]HAL65701.1 hypothetical protein [Bacteroidales bacterium]
MTKVTKRSINIFLQIFILIGAYGYLAWKLFMAPTAHLTKQNISQLFYIQNFWLVIILVLLLMLVNWSIEAIKWKYLISKIEEISFLLALKAIFTGVTVSIFTPNRVGEFFGRVFLLKNKQPVRGILITILGSFSQIVIYMICGITSGIIMYYRFLLPQNPSLGKLQWIIIPLACISLVITILIFLNISFLGNILQNLLPKQWHRIKRWFAVLSYYSRRELAKVLILSLLRYCVFSFQYIILLRMFNIPLSIGNLFMAVMVIFALLVVTPSVALSELGVRSTVAVFVIGMMLPTGLRNDPMVNLGIISAASILWLVNVALPAIIGSFFVFKLKFFKGNNSKS